MYFCTAPERLVFATDWPHTMFDGYDTTGWVQTVVEWCVEIGGKDAVIKLFKSNAQMLWRGREKRQ